MSDRTITAEEASSLLYDDAIAIEFVSDHRWYTKRLVVFRDGTTLMGFHHLLPKTEEQEGQDEFEADPVPVFPVTAREVTKTVYEQTKTEV